VEKWTKNINEGNIFLYTNEACQQLRQEYLLVVGCNM